MELMPLMELGRRQSGPIRATPCNCHSVRQEAAPGIFNCIVNCQCTAAGALAEEAGQPHTRPAPSSCQITATFGLPSSASVLDSWPAAKGSQ